VTPSVATSLFATPSQHVIFGTSKLRDAIGHDVGKQAPSVATPTKDTFSACKPVDTIGNAAGKSKLGVATLSNDVIFSIGEPRDANGHDVGKPTPSVTTTFVVTPTQDAIFAQMNLGMLLGTALENRRLASRRLRNLNEANINLGTQCDTILANRRRASRRIEKIGNVAEMSLGIHTTLKQTDAKRSDNKCHDADHRHVDND
jgi:hypothetical protein